MNSPALKRRLSTCALVATALVGGSLMTACTDHHIVGGLVGGTAVGYAYERQNTKARRQLEHQRATGQISHREYQRRRDDISDRSLIY